MRPPEKLMLRKHPELQKEINDVIVAIRVHQIHTPESWGDTETLLTIVKERTPKPTWEQVVELLDRAYKALDEQRYDPIKYKEGGNT